MSDRVIDLASARPIESAGWLKRLQRGDGGTLPTIANALIILANDPAMADLFSFNAFTSQHLLMHAVPAAEDGASQMPGPYPRPWGGEDIALVQAYMQRVWSSRFGRPTIEDAILTAAALQQFHPITDWLATLKWDGQRRLDTWLPNAFDAENNAYHRAVGAKFMIAAVRRVRSPGVKFDHMVILEGVQGLGKSTAARVLFGDAWFSDAIPADLSSKDAAMALLGVWCLEFGEIEHLIRNEPETIKAFLSRQVDRYRPPYAKAFVERPRQGVLLGTTNSDDYLRDSTGNRRIWPVRCRAADVAWITMHREQLWAEAAAREASGEAIWLKDEDIAGIAAAAQSARMAEDAWEGAVMEWAVGREQIRIPDVLTHALSMSREKQTRREVLRVADILRRNGWRRWVGRVANTPGVHRIWIAPNRGMPSEPETTDQADLL